jgi:hypothetical protein
MRGGGGEGGGGGGVEREGERETCLSMSCVLKNESPLNHGKGGAMATNATHSGTSHATEVDTMEPYE